MTFFMAVTVHWIACTHGGTLELKTALGGFRWVKESHSGENIMACLVDILKELDILERIGGITLDNASNNNTAMDFLETHLGTLGIRGTIPSSSTSTASPMLSTSPSRMHWLHYLAPNPLIFAEFLIPTSKQHGTKDSKTRDMLPHSRQILSAVSKNLFDTSDPLVSAVRRSVKRSTQSTETRGS
jgi:hypothetical protein